MVVVVPSALLIFPSACSTAEREGLRSVTTATDLSISLSFCGICFVALLLTSSTFKKMRSSW